MKTALQSVELDIDFNGCKLSSSDLKKLLEIARNARNTRFEIWSTVLSDNSAYEFLATRPTQNLKSAVR